MGELAAVPQGAPGGQLTLRSPAGALPSSLAQTREATRAAGKADFKITENRAALSWAASSHQCSIGRKQTGSRCSRQVVGWAQGAGHLLWQRRVAWETSWGRGLSWGVAGQGAWPEGLCYLSC